MKDIKFSGGALTTAVTFRVDSISGSGNLTVMETYGLDDREKQTIDTTVEKSLLNSFRKLPNNFKAFTDFATTNSLDLVVSETNGNSPIQKIVNLVVTAPAASSTTADTTPTFSGTGTPGGAISIVIASTTVTTTVSSSGTWTVDFSTLASGAKSAVVTLTKGGVSKSVTRAFTIS